MKKKPIHTTKPLSAKAILDRLGIDEETKIKAKKLVKELKKKK